MKTVNETVDEVANRFDVEILLCFPGIAESKLAVEYSMESCGKVFDVDIHGFLMVEGHSRGLRFLPVFLP